MHLLHIAADEIKRLYTIPNTAYASVQEVEMVWQAASDIFNHALGAENNKHVLEQCVLADPNWELSVDERLCLLEKAKKLGASSRPFLLDYHGYLAAHLDPGPEQAAAAAMLEVLLQAE